MIRRARHKAKYLQATRAGRASGVGDGEAVLQKLFACPGGWRGQAQIRYGVFLIV